MVGTMIACPQNQSGYLTDSPCLISDSFKSTLTRGYNETTAIDSILCKSEFLLAVFFSSKFQTLPKHFYSTILISNN